MKDIERMDGSFRTGRKKTGTKRLSSRRGHNGEYPKSKGDTRGPPLHPRTEVYENDLQGWG
jgi:hypothetical protein